MGRQSAFVGHDKTGLGHDTCPDLEPVILGCHTLKTEAACIAHKDGRFWDSRFASQPCAWCCGEKCMKGGYGNLCEPQDWVERQGAFVGHDKTGLGHDTCPEDGGDGGDGGWHCHGDTNAWAGHGSTQDIDDDGSSLKDVSMRTCQQHCNDTPDCNCVVYKSANGQCWR